MQAKSYGSLTLPSLKLNRSDRAGSEVHSAETAGADGARYERTRPPKAAGFFFERCRLAVAASCKYASDVTGRVTGNRCRVIRDRVAGSGVHVTRVRRRASRIRRSL